MINREYVSATCEEMGGVDAYGQMLSSVTSTRTIEIAIGLLEHNDSSNIKYQDCDFYGLTKDKQVNDKCIITVGTDKYKVKYVAKHKNRTELFLCQ